MRCSNIISVLIILIIYKAKLVVNFLFERIPKICLHRHDPLNEMLFSV